MPLSGRQETIAIEADLMAACPLKWLVRRCRFSTGILSEPSLRHQSSGYLRFNPHTSAQLQAQGRYDLEDGVKTRTALSRQCLIQTFSG
jgi:hypothetical protein